MTGKVQKIKEWISKEQDGLMDAQGNFEYPEHEGAYHILCNLDTYIDSLQEELKECMYSKDNYTDEDRKALCDGCEEKCRFNKKEESINNGLDLGCGVIWKDEEPVSEDFEQALETEWKGYVDRGAATVDALEDNTQELAFANGFFRGWNYPKPSVWHDASERPVASKTKIVLYTNGKWDMFKAYETKDDHDNYWSGVNQALEEKGVLVKRWAYVEDLLKL